jgi:hypothetical protein
MNIKDGDIFFWSYKDELKHKDSMTYWAKSRYAIAKDGILRDTFWSNHCDGFNLTYEKALDELELQYLGNLNELEKKSEYFVDYYDEKDCVNINHSNSLKGNFYIRCGAKRSKKKMVEVIKYKIEKERGNIKFSVNEIKYLKRALKEIEDGCVLLDNVYI